MIDFSVVTDAPRISRLLDRSSTNLPMSGIQDHARGAMLGLAVGNLLGLPVEGWPHSRIRQGFPDGLSEIDPREAHERMDDDLAQAVDLGEVLLSDEEYVENFAARLIAWERDNGRGIGITTAEVISEFGRAGNPLEASRTIYERKNRIAPNGGVMRCAPVAIARMNQPADLVRDSALTCAVTHYAETCQWSCILVNAVIAELLKGAQPDLPGLLVAAMADGCPDLHATAHRDGIPSAALDAIVANRTPPPDAGWLFCDHKLIGHTLLAMQFGLWAATTPLSLEEALIASVEAGGDTDTNAAVAGAVLGARYGAASIPQRWLDCIPQRGRVEDLADDLLALSTG